MLALYLHLKLEPVEGDSEDVDISVDFHDYDLPLKYVPSYVGDVFKLIDDYFKALAIPSSHA